MLITLEEINNELEKLNIVYDILIDEERFNEVDVELKGCDLDKEINKIFINDARKTGEIFYLLNKVDELFKEERTTIKLNGFSLAELTPLLGQYADLWRYILLAKKTRAVMQSIGKSESFKALDEVAEYLLSKFFLLSECQGDESEKPYEFKSRKFRTLYYNEISQCHTGYLSTGYADKALRQYGFSKCHYELLGLYNKAVGLSHHDDYRSKEKALKYFGEVIDYYKESEEKENLGYDYGGSSYKIVKKLWDMYVYYPAILHKANILIQLFRSQESVDLLCKLQSKFGLNQNAAYYQLNINQFKSVDISLQYKHFEILILKAQAFIETGDLVKAANCIPLNDSDIEIQVKQKGKIIFDKYLSLKAKFIIEKEKQNLDCSKIGGAFTLTLDYAFSLIENIHNQVENDKEEKVLNIITWLEAFKLYLNKNLKRWNAKRKFLIIVLEIVLGSSDSDNSGSNGNIFDRWIPKRDKLISSVVEILEIISTDDDFKKDQQLKPQAIKFWELMMKEHGNKKPSNHIKVKFYRQILLLNEKPTVRDPGLDFPSDANLDLIKTFVKDHINSDFYTQHLNFNTEYFDQTLIYKSSWPWLRNRYVFTVLRKWQSYTPSLGSYSLSSRGGGYFLYKVDNKGEIEEGIVIDPGYDFVENFLEHGFTMMDINAVVFTHAHIDHSDDFRSILTLFHEMNKRGRVVKKDHWKHRKVLVIVTPSCFKHFYPQLKDSYDDIRDVVVVDPCVIGENNFDSITKFVIKTVPAFHKEFDDETNCSGIIIDDKQGNKLIGLTGDTVWTGDLAQQFRGYPVVLINMGALLDVRKGDTFEKTFLQSPDEIKRLIYKQNHLYLPGLITLLEELRNLGTTRLAIVGELGEELKHGLRRDLFYKLNELITSRNNCWFPSPLRVAIEDTGLTIAWDDGTILSLLVKGERPFIHCMRCKKPIEPKDIKMYMKLDERQSEQLYYYCEECLDKIEAHETGESKDWQYRYLPPRRS